MGIFQQLGNAVFGPVGGFLGGGLDTTITKNKTSGHPSGGSSPQNLLSGSISNAFGNLTSGGSGSVISGALSAYGNHKATKAHFNAAQTDLVKLRNQAERAGFNPLTVLRQTGGQGFQKGYAGGLSSANFYSALGNGISNYNNGEYLQQSRDIQIATAQKGYTLMGAQAPDPYSGFGDTIPVKIGNVEANLKTDVAKRLKLEPGNNVTPGEMAEIFGEIWGEGISALYTQIQENILEGGVTTPLRQENGWLDYIVKFTQKAPYSPISIAANQIDKVKTLLEDVDTSFMDEIKDFMQNELNNPTDRKYKDTRINWYETFSGALSSANKLFDDSITGVTNRIRQEGDKLKNFFGYDF